MFLIDDILAMLLWLLRYKVESGFYGRDQQ